MSLWWYKVWLEKYMNWNEFKSNINEADCYIFALIFPHDHPPHVLLDTRCIFQALQNNVEEACEEFLVAKIHNNSNYSSNGHF